MSRSAKLRSELLESQAAYQALLQRHERLRYEFQVWREVVKYPAEPSSLFAEMGHQADEGRPACRFCKVKLAAFLEFPTACRSNPQRAATESVKWQRSKMLCRRCETWKVPNSMVVLPNGETGDTCLMCFNPPKQPELIIDYSLDPREYKRVCELCRKEVDIRSIGYYAARCEDCWTDSERPAFRKALKRWSR